MDKDIVHVHTQIHVHICPIAGMSVSISAAVSVSLSVFTVILMLCYFAMLVLTGHFQLKNRDMAMGIKMDKSMGSTKASTQTPFMDTRQKAKGVKRVEDFLKQNLLSNFNSMFIKPTQPTGPLCKQKSMKI